MRPCLSSGFTLIETSMAMVVMGLVVLSVYPALTAMRQANQVTLTQSNLRSLMVATAAYVQANGCMPCPAVPGGTTANFGKLGYDTNVACGVCSRPQGIPPFASLGIPASVARDGWGHWITMRVDPVLTNPSPAIVPPTATCTSDDADKNYCLSTEVGKSAKGVCKSGLSNTGRISIKIPGGATQQAAVIFISHGAAGYGSYVATPRFGGGEEFLLPFASNYAPCSTASGFAQCNSAERNTKSFYDAPTVISDTDAYDDLLAYADRNTLVSMLGNGACQTTW